LPHCRGRFAWEILVVDDQSSDGTPEAVKRFAESKFRGRLVQAIETAAFMLGSDKSRGYCLEMICADFLAGANLDTGQPDVLLRAICPYSNFYQASRNRPSQSSSRSRSNELESGETRARQARRPRIRRTT
jgi:glycosyltransferase involved in cell wall biosynthesis